MTTEWIVPAISLALSGASLAAAVAVCVKAIGLAKEAGDEEPYTRLGADLDQLKSKLQDLERRVAAKDGSATERDRILVFLEALDRWRKIVPGGSALLVGSEIRELEAARGSSRSTQSLGEAPIDVDSLFFEIAKTALSNSDNTLDKPRKNRALQAALQQLVSKAGLKLLEPEPNDQVNPELHLVVKTIRGNGRNGKTIESVLSRGLTRAGRVLKTAEVISRY